MKKALSIILSLSFCLAVFTGCVNDTGETSDGVSSATQANSTASEEIPLTQEQAKAQMIERSLLSQGNNYRFLKAVEKAKQGEEVNIAYLGGSITQGMNASPMETSCYAYLSTQIFAEKYATDKEKVNCINAGIPGTPSTLGILRCEDDIISKNPDIVFIEFAVNDASDSLSQEIYESLVVKLLNSESSPAVVLLFTVLENGYTCQENMSAIGEGYDLGMISVKNAVFTEIDAGRMTFADYASDEAHPSNEGHALVAEFIGNYFDKAYEKSADSSYELPETPIVGTAFATLKNIKDDSAFITDTGFFEYERLRCFTYSRGWQHKKSTDESALTFKLTFSKLILSYKQVNQETAGNAEVYIDGRLITTLHGYKSDAWGNIETDIVWNNYESSEHTVEIRMAQEPSAWDKSFILLGIGYVD